MCTLAPVFSGVASAGSSVSTTCAVDLTWAAAAVECGGPARYNVYRSTVANFTPGPDNLVVAGIAGTSMLDVNGLVQDATYHYVVRAVDLANGVEEGNQAKQSVFVSGPNDGIYAILAEDFTATGTFFAESVRRQGFDQAPPAGFMLK